MPPFKVSVLAMTADGAVGGATSLCDGIRDPDPFFPFVVAEQREQQRSDDSNGAGSSGGKPQFAVRQEERRWRAL